MKFNTRKLTGLTAFCCLMSLMFVLSGCTPQAEAPKKADPNQAFIDSFCKGEPDRSVPFPEAEFAKAKELQKQKKLNTAEKLLMDKLEDARVSARGTTQLGQYLVRLNNILFERGNDSLATKYGEIALKIFYDQPIAKRPIAPWFVNIHSYLGMSYERMGKYKDAEKQFQSAIRIASNAPRAEVADEWMKLIYQRLAACFDAQKQPEQAKKVRESLKNLKRG